MPGADDDSTRPRNGLLGITRALSMAGPAHGLWATWPRWLALGDCAPAVDLAHGFGVKSMRQVAAGRMAGAAGRKVAVNPEKKPSSSSGPTESEGRAYKRTALTKNY